MGICGNGNFLGKGGGIGKIGKMKRGGDGKKREPAGRMPRYPKIKEGIKRKKRKKEIHLHHVIYVIRDDRG